MIDNRVKKTMVEMARLLNYIDELPQSVNGAILVSPYDVDGIQRTLRNFSYVFEDCNDIIRDNTHSAINGLIRTDGYNYFIDKIWFGYLMSAYDFGTPLRKYMDKDVVAMPSIDVENGELVHFSNQCQYIMVNNALGSGSFGKTVLLRDTFIDEKFVAKKYEPDFTDVGLKKQFYSTFLNEVKILHSLSHKNVVRVFKYHAYPEETTGFIFMEYIEGVHIDNFLKGNPQLINDIFKQLIKGFVYIEQRTIHRDIRPGNILVDTMGTVKIIDFGIGKSIENENTPNTFHNQIHRLTLSDEELNGEYTCKTDMFHFGVMLDRLIKEAKYNESQFFYSAILEKMSRKNPNDRYDSFADIMKEIDAFSLSKMNITKVNKALYQNFAGALFNALDYFIGKRIFNNNIDSFLEKLENVIDGNSFEEYIINISELLKCVINSDFHCNKSSNENLSRSDAKAFLRWVKKLSPPSQQLILNNLITKLSTKDTEPPVYNSPYYADDSFELTVK